MKRAVKLIAVTAALVVVAAGCVEPGNPGTQQRNDFLEATAGGYAIGLGARVAPLGNGTNYACPAPDRDHWGVTTHAGYRGEIVVCYTLGLPTGTAHRGTVYMHEMGHAYAFRLEDVGSTWKQGPISNDEMFADCFSQFHGGNAAFNINWQKYRGYKNCDQSWLDRIALMEQWAPPNGAGWWPPA